jgi:hypothetical protein
VNETERLAADMRALIKSKQEDQDAADLLLVQRNAVTLADLYRKGKARGLLSSRSEYG